jgi:hypothetical protein
MLTNILVFFLSGGGNNFMSFSNPGLEQVSSFDVVRGYKLMCMK